MRMCLYLCDFDSNFRKPYMLYYPIASPIYIPPSGPAFNIVKHRIEKGEEGRNEFDMREIEHTGLFVFRQAFARVSYGLNGRKLTGREVGISIKRRQSGLVGGSLLTFVARRGVCVRANWKKYPLASRWFSFCLLESIY